MGQSFGAVKVCVIAKSRVPEARGARPSRLQPPTSSATFFSPLQPELFGTSTKKTVERRWLEILIDGKWTDDDELYRRGGAFVQPATVFRAFVTADGSSPCPIEAGRYHLYVANPRPGAAAPRSFAP